MGELQVAKLAVVVKAEQKRLIHDSWRCGTTVRSACREQLSPSSSRKASGAVVAGLSELVQTAACVNRIAQRWTISCNIPF